MLSFQYGTTPRSSTQSTFNRLSIPATATFLLQQLCIVHLKASPATTKAPSRDHAQLANLLLQPVDLLLQAVVCVHEPVILHALNPYTLFVVGIILKHLPLPEVDPVLAAKAAWGVLYTGVHIYMHVAAGRTVQQS